MFYVTQLHLTLLLPGSLAIKEYSQEILELFENNDWSTMADMINKGASGVFLK